MDASGEIWKYGNTINLTEENGWSSGWLVSPAGSENGLQV